MSSKILEADDPRAAGPMIWRRVGEAGVPGAPVQSDAAQIAEIQRQYEQSVQAARAAGFAEGEQAGRKRAAEEVQPVIERLARSIEELGHMRGRLRREA